jgi:hypothetical protein
MQSFIRLKDSMMNMKEKEVGTLKQTVVQLKEQIKTL